MNVLVDDIGGVVAKIRSTFDATFGQSFGAGAPHYMYGHRLEIANNLLKKDAAAIRQYQKYPLIALRLDTPEAMADEVIGQRINIAIIALTKKEYTSAQRYEKVFKPLLYPLYYQFFDALRASGKFTWKDYGKLPVHTKIDRPFWGVTGNEGNTKYIFNDPLDAIEIIDLKVNQHFKKC